MSFQDCLVVARPSGWSITVGSTTEPLDADCSAEELAICVDLMVKVGGAKRANCILAPDANSTFFTTLRLSEAVDPRDRQSLAYELENHLPIDAESTVADFAVIPPQRSGERAVAAVAIELEKWKPVVDALESKGIMVRAVVPSPLLVIRSLVRQTSDSRTVNFVLVNDATCDCITARGKSILQWKHMALDANALQRHQLLDAEPADCTLVVGADEADQKMIRGVLGEVDFVSESITAHELRGAEETLRQRGSQGFDLRRDQLGPADRLRMLQPQVTLASMAALLLLVAIIVGGWWRTHWIETQIVNVHSEQRSLFEAAMPETRIPAALLRRVRSEHTAVRNSRVGGTGVDIPVAASDVLRQILGALPSDVRFRVTSIDILDGDVDLQLQVRSPVGAGAIASSLSTAGFNVKPPVTSQKDARTYDSTLKAQWILTPKATATNSPPSPNEQLARGEVTR